MVGDLDLLDGTGSRMRAGSCVPVFSFSGPGVPARRLSFPYNRAHAMLRAAGADDPHLCCAALDLAGTARAAAQYGRPGPAQRAGDVDSAAPRGIRRLADADAE